MFILDASVPVQAQLPSRLCLNRTIQRSRNRENRPIPLPLDLEDLVIPDQYRVTNSGAEFLLFDSGPEVDRVLIFSTRNNLRMLRQSRHWYADGTFKTVPNLFGQMYTIHGIV